MNAASQGGQLSGCRGRQRMPFWDPKWEDFPPAGAFSSRGIQPGLPTSGPERGPFPSSCCVPGGTGKVEGWEEGGIHPIWGRERKLFWGFLPFWE